jgi:homoaconitase/3-isopropylmalate dehydratase large subunit
MTEKKSVKIESEARKEQLKNAGYDVISFSGILLGEVKKFKKDSRLIVQNMSIKSDVVTIDLNTYEYLILAFLCISSKDSICRSKDEIQARAKSVFAKEIPNFRTHLSSLKSKISEIFGNQIEIEKTAENKYIIRYD